MLLQIRFPSCLFPALQPNPPSSNSSHPAFYTFPATLLSPLSSACPPSLLRHVSHPASASPTAEGSPYLSSAAAVAGAIRRSSPESPVEFTQRVDRPGKTGVVLPSSDFQRLCVEQLDLFRAVVDPHAILSVYARPAGSYVMDQLELRRVTYYPGVEISENEECVIVVGNFAIPGGLHIAEIAISRQEVEFVAELGAIVLPLVKHPFVVGFLVAELPNIKVSNCATFAWESLGFKEEFDRSYGQFTSEKRLRAVMISRSLATAYVMDQDTGYRLLGYRLLGIVTQQFWGTFSFRCLRTWTSLLSHFPDSRRVFDYGILPSGKTSWSLETPILLDSRLVFKLAVS